MPKEIRKNYKELNDMGIKVIIVWGCEIKEMIKDEKIKKNMLLKLIKSINGISDAYRYNLEKYER